MVRRYALAVIVLGLAGAACSPTADPARPDAIAPTPVPTVGATPAPSTSSTSTTAALDSTLGTWIETRFPKDRLIMDMVALEDSLVALLADDDGRFRLLEVDEAGSWNRITDWSRPPMDGFEYVQWLTMAVVEGGFAVSGSGRLDPPRGEMDSLPIFALVDATTGETAMVVDHARADGGNLSDIARLGGTFIGVGGAESEARSWGPGLWTSSDALNWEPVEAPPQVRDLLYGVGPVAVSTEVAVALGRGNYNDDPPWVLWSDDGESWAAALLPAVEPDEVVSLYGVVHDGIDFTIVGGVQAPGGASHDVMWSSSDGINWERQESQPGVFGDGEFRPRGLWGSDEMVALSGTTMHRTSQLYCYDDFETCQHSFTSLWRRSDGEWLRIVAPSDNGRAVSGIASIGSQLVVTGRIDHRGVAWVWLPGGGDTRFYAEPLDISPPVADLPLVGPDRTIEPNVEYAYPLSMACYGIQSLGELNGKLWIHAGGPTVVRPDWPVATSNRFIWQGEVLYGTIEMVTPDRINYIVPGEGVVMFYEPAPENYERTYCF